MDQEVVQVAGATAVVPALADRAAAVAREVVRAVGATVVVAAVAAADPVRVAAQVVTARDMVPVRVAQAPVATQAHGTLSVVAARDRALIPMPEASG